MFPQLLSPRTPAGQPHHTPRSNADVGRSFLPSLSSVGGSTPQNTQLPRLPVLELDVGLDVDQLDDETLFRLAGEAKAEEHRRVVEEEQRRAARMEQKIPVDQMAEEDNIDVFVEIVSNVWSLNDLIALKLLLEEHETALEKKIDTLQEYYASSKQSKSVQGNQCRKLAELRSGVELNVFKRNAVDTQLNLVETRNATRRASFSSRSSIDSPKRRGGPEAQTYTQQQERIRRAGGDAFDAVLKNPLQPSQVHPRFKNELVLPWLLRIASLEPDAVERSDALAQWMFHEFLDDYSTTELLRQSAEVHRISTAKRMLRTLHPTLTTPIPPVVTTHSAVLAERSMPDLTRVVLQAIAVGAMRDVAMMLSAPSCYVGKALRDAEMLAILLYSVLRSGQVDSLQRLLRQGVMHEHIVHALLFMAPNYAALSVERSMSVKLAAALSQQQLELNAKALQKQRRGLARPQGVNLPTDVAEHLHTDDWDEDPVDVDALLNSWEVTQTTASPAGGYCDPHLGRKPSSRRMNAQAPSKAPVSFTELLDTGRLHSVPQNLHALGVPYFETECVAKFGDKAFAPLTGAFHVSVRGDVPIILPSCIADTSSKTSPKSLVPPASNSTRGPSVARASPLHYYEAHISMDAITSGEDCVHIGWCDETFGADGVQPALLGNDEHSLGISFVAYDTVESALHRSSVVNSRSAVLDGNCSALSMRARSRIEGFASRFSASGDAVAVAVKHFNGHSQRHFSHVKHALQLSLPDDIGAFSETPNEDYTPTEEQCGNVNITEYEEGYFDEPAISLTPACVDHGSALPRALYNAEIRSSGAARNDSLSNSEFVVRNPQETIGGSIVVIGCLLDVTSRTTTFYINGVSLGISFDALPEGKMLYPCMSMVKFRDGAVTAPTCRFCFDHDEIRYFPVVPDTLTRSLSSQGDLSTCPLSHSVGSVDGSGSEAASARRLKLFDIEAKLCCILHMLETPELQFCSALEDKSSESAPEGLTEDVVDQFPLGVLCLNKRCTDRRMYFKPVAIINESIDLGAEHQDLDLAVLCCSANPTPLLFALLQRRRDVALHLALSRLVSVNETDDFGTSAILIAAALGYEEVVEALIQRSGAAALTEPFRGYLPLHCAIMAEHETCARVILSYAETMLCAEQVRSVLNTATPRGNTPLHLATKLKLLRTVRMLLACGADATIVDKRSHATPLFIACSTDAEDIAEALLQSGQYNGHPAVDAPVRDQGGVALCWAAQKGMTRLMPLFAAAGADPSAMLAEATPLISAIACQQEPTALALIQAYLGHVDASTLKYASLESEGHLNHRHPFSRSLNQTSSKPTSGDDLTALARASPPPSRLRTSPVAALYGKFDVHAVDPRSRSTALHLACELDLQTLVSVLLEYGASICCVNKQFATPLHVAVQHEHEDLAIFIANEGKNLIQEGIGAFDVSLMDARGETVLHGACRNGMKRLVEKLLTLFSTQEVSFIISRTKNHRIKAIDVLAENRQGDTPLMIAIKAGHIHVAELLITSVDPSLNLASAQGANGTSKVVLECVDREFFKLAYLLVRRGAPVAPDIKALVEREWEAIMSSQERPRNSHLGLSTCSAQRTSPLVYPGARSGGRRISLFDCVPETPFAPTSGTSHHDAPTNVFNSSAAKSTSGKEGGGLRKTKSVSQMVAARLVDSQKLMAKASMRRRSTVQKLLRPVGARFDDEVASALLRLFHVDELVYEFESIMGYGSLSAHEVVEHGELIVSALMAHSHICFSATEANVLAKAGYAYLHSRASTTSLVHRKDVAKLQHSLGRQVFRIIRQFSPHQGPQAVDALHKALDVYRVFEVKQHRDSPLVAVGAIGGGVSMDIQESYLIDPFSGVTALQLASFLGLTHVVDFLCDELNVDPMHCGSRTHDNLVWNPNITMLYPIRVAVIGGHCDTVSALLATDRCNLHALEAPDVWPSRDSLLHSAARLPSAPMISILLEAGADPCGSPNADGDDLWQVAIREPTGVVLHSLLRHDVAPDPGFLLSNPTEYSSNECHGSVVKRRGASFLINADNGEGTDDQQSGPLGLDARDDEDNFPFSLQESLEQRNTEYFRRWFGVPFLDTELFDSGSIRRDAPTATSLDDSSCCRSVLNTAHQQKRSYADAYYCTLMFGCVRHNPKYVLQLMTTTPLSINVTHPITEDSLLTYIIHEAFAGDATQKDAMVKLAMEVILRFQSELNLNVVRLDGETALSLASRVGNMELIQLLLERGAPLIVGKQATAATGTTGARQKVVIWRLLAQLHYTLQHNEVIELVAKALENAPATRRAFIAAVMPNLHPLVQLRLATKAPGDIVSACTSSSSLGAEATMSFWLMIVYVSCFLPDHLKSEYYLSKRMMDSVIGPLITGMPPVVLLSFHLLKLRQKVVREQQAYLQQIMHLLHPPVPCGLQQQQSSGVRSAPGRMSRTPSRHSVTEGNTGMPFNRAGADQSPTSCMNPATTDGNTLAVPVCRSRRVSLAESVVSVSDRSDRSNFGGGAANESEPLTLKASLSVDELPLVKSPGDGRLDEIDTQSGVFQREASATVPSPLTLLTTPPNLPMHLPIHTIPLGIELPRPQKGLSIEVLHFKISDAWASALREASTSGSSDMTPATTAPTNAVGSPTVPQQQHQENLTPPTDRLFDTLELIVRFGKNDAWTTFVGMVPPTMKLGAVVKERCLLAIAAGSSNAALLLALLVTRSDVMFMDEIVTEHGLPVGMTHQSSPTAQNAPSSFHRQSLMAPFRVGQRRGPRSNDDAPSDKPARSRGSVSSPFRFSVDMSARSQGTQALNRRLTYDAAAMLKAAATRGTATNTAESVVPGSIVAIKFLNDATTTSNAVATDSAPPAPVRFPYCLFDWAVHSHYFFYHHKPVQATLDTIMLLMNKRCPPTYQLFLMLLSRDKSSLDDSPNVEDDYFWRTSNKERITINALSSANDDSWLHLLVMHNQVILADFFLTVTKGKFGHLIHKNARGLVPADYCSSYQMAMILDHHQCFNLGFRAPSSPTASGRNSPRGFKAPLWKGLVSKPAAQLLVVPKGFLHLLDNDNSNIDRRLQIPPPPSARSSGVGYNDGDEPLVMLVPPRRHCDSLASARSSDGALVNGHQRNRLLAPHAPLRVPDELILRNQRVNQRFLQDVFLPLVLFPASATEDNLRIRPPGDILLAADTELSPCELALSTTMRQSPRQSSKGAVPQVQVLTPKSPQALATLQTDQRYSGTPRRKTNAPQQDIGQPLSLQLLAAASSSGANKGNVGSKSTPLGSKHGASSPLSPVTQPPSPRKYPHNQKLKSCTELVDALQRNMFFVQVDDVHNTTGVRLQQQCNIASRIDAGKLVDASALFVSTSLFHLALKANLLRLQNHRVAAYDQLDNAVMCGAAALLPPGRHKMLKEMFLEVAGNTLPSLGLEIAPEYAGH